jgi:CheY-like chemotaxis protein
MPNVNHVRLQFSIEFGNPMTKTVVDCGNCGPDYNTIRKLVQSQFDAVVLQTHGLEDTLEQLAQRPVDLVTVNRKLDRDYTDGIEVIRGIKSDPRFSSVPVMLITNYEEHQQEAIQAGAVHGFGKLSVGDPATVRLLESILGSAKQTAG